MTPTTLIICGHLQQLGYGVRQPLSVALTHQYNSLVRMDVVQANAEYSFEPYLQPINKLRTPTAKLLKSHAWSSVSSDMHPATLNEIVNFLPEFIAEFSVEELQSFLSGTTHLFQRENNATILRDLLRRLDLPRKYALLSQVPVNTNTALIALADISASPPWTDECTALATYVANPLVEHLLVQLLTKNVDGIFRRDSLLWSLFQVTKSPEILRAAYSHVNKHHYINAVLQVHRRKPYTLEIVERYPQFCEAIGYAQFGMHDKLQTIVTLEHLRSLLPEH